MSHSLVLDQLNQILTATPTTGWWLMWGLMIIWLVGFGIIFHRHVATSDRPNLNRSAITGIYVILSGGLGLLSAGLLILSHLL